MNFFGELNKSYINLKGVAFLASLYTMLCHTVLSLYKYCTVGSFFSIYHSTFERVPNGTTCHLVYVRPVELLGATMLSTTAITENLCTHNTRVGGKGPKS